MRRLLLTGGAGFIGRHCVPLLARSGFEIHALTSRPAPAEDSSVHWHWADLLAAADVDEFVARSRPSHLLHLAWCTTPGVYWQSEENYRWLEASINLAERFVKAGGRRLVIAGSCAEYDWRSGECTEASTQLSSASVYAKCKNALHDEIRGLARAGAFTYAWGRVFFPFGPGEPRQKLVSSTILALRDNREVVCRNGAAARDFIYVQDAADALVRLLVSDLEGPVNIGTGETATIADVINRLAEALDRLQLVRHLSQGERSEPPLVVADTGRLARELQWRPSWALDAALRQTIADV